MMTCLLQLEDMRVVLSNVTKTNSNRALCAGPESAYLIVELNMFLFFLNL